MSYQKNFLAKVIFQANYQSIPQLKLKIEDDLKNSISSRTGGEPQIGHNQFVNIGVQPDSSQYEVNRELQWSFIGDPIHVIINSNWFQVITMKYTNFTNFHPIICEVFKGLEKTYNPQFNRIALRYINNISFKEGSIFDFKNLIDDSLTSFSEVFKSENLKRSMGSMESYAEEENINTKFIFGFWNSIYPNPISKREFILDYDNSTLYNPSTDKIDDILQKLRSHNNKLFEKSIKPGLRESMNSIE